MQRFKRKYAILVPLICFVILQAVPSSCEEFIHKKYVDVNQTRKDLSKAYIREHYGIKVDNPTIIPKIIVVHWTGLDSLEGSYNSFKNPYLSPNRKEISSGGPLNVCAHFLVDQDGTVYQLLPPLYFARHVIGLNYYAIGIENVGGLKKALSAGQLQANERLIRYLVATYSTIEYVIGHHEYRLLEGTPLFLEKDPTYRNKKRDPGENFMQSLRKNLGDLYNTSRLKSLTSITKKKGESR